MYIFIIFIFAYEINLSKIPFSPAVVYTETGVSDMWDRWRSRICHCGLDGNRRISRVCWSSSIGQRCRVCYRRIGDRRDRLSYNRGVVSGDSRRRIRVGKGSGVRRDRLVRDWWSRVCYRLCDWCGVCDGWASVRNRGCVWRVRHLGNGWSRAVSHGCGV